jgi:hypothetical protein
MVAGERSRPILQHAHQPSVGEGGADLVLGEESEAEAGDRGASQIHAEGDRYAPAQMAMVGREAPERAEA